MKPAGIELFDIYTGKTQTDFPFRLLEPHSRGPAVWFVDGEGVHMASGAATFNRAIRVTINATG
jgi:hypothetical protein